MDEHSGGLIRAYSNQPSEDLIFISQGSRERILTFAPLRCGLKAFFDSSMYDTSVSESGSG